jgi:hypothetical protein
MEWPNDEFWGALDEKQWTIEDCGDLVVSTGRLLICDPHCYLASKDPRLGCRLNVPPGRYPVKLSIEREGDSEIWRVWYASVLLSSEPEVTRKEIVCAADEAIPAGADPDDFTGFPVETGTACFVDEGALTYGMPPDPSLWTAHIFLRIDGQWLSHNRSLCEIYKALDESAYKGIPGEYLEGYSVPENERWEYLRSKSKLHCGAVKIPLPLAKDGSNIIMFSSGMGDGAYPVVAGYDEQGRATAIHIDFIGGPDDDEGAPD